MCTAAATAAAAGYCCWLLLQHVHPPSSLALLGPHSPLAVGSDGADAPPTMIAQSYPMLLSFEGPAAPKRERICLVYQATGQLCSCRAREPRPAPELGSHVQRQPAQGRGPCHRACKDRQSSMKKSKQASKHVPAALQVAQVALEQQALICQMHPKPQVNQTHGLGRSSAKCTAAPHG